VTHFIDFCIYAVLMLWSFIKCGLMGAAILLPFFLIWCLLDTSAKADRKARELWENRD
jgi:hypothetical protein